MAGVKVNIKFEYPENHSKNELYEKASTKGSSLAQYGIVIALVGIALVPAFFILGDSIKQSLGNFNSAMEDTNAKMESNSGQTSPTPSLKNITPGTLGGSSAAPKIQCSGNDCVIDFGDYVIEGIPGNFSEFIQSSGTSGGTHLLATVLEEIAQKAPVDEETKNLIQQLANNGHGIAYNEEYMHNQISQLIAENGNNSTSYDIASILDLNEETNMLDFHTVLEQLNTSLGTNADPNYQNTLIMINALSDNILNLASNALSNSSAIFRVADANGALTEEDTQKYLQAIHDGSVVTDMDSSVICGMGNGADNGYNCN